MGDRSPNAMVRRLSSATAGVKHKVLAYITREHRGRTELLVFDQRDQPEAGTQVPAGTVEPGEPLEHALWREVAEEAGLWPAQLRLVRQVAAHPEPEWDQVRHVFHLAAVSGLPDAWTHTVQGSGEDQGMAFVYRWALLDIKLAGDQHRWLAALQEGQV
jgi:ADP-ribose pyrophosphatase YjhB (NUDIX family)